MGRRFPLLALTLVAAFFAAPSAYAAQGSLVNGVMIYTADPGERNNAVFLEGFQSEPTFEVREDPGVAIAAQSPCFTIASNVMECPQDGNGSGAITLFQASLGDDDDSITLQANLPSSIGAGGGNDRMTGGPAADFLRGGQGGDTMQGADGSDQLVGDDPGVAGGGNDLIAGGNGNDAIDGQGGDDVFPAESFLDGADDIKGGDGTDTASFAARSDPQQISIDDVANDGGGATPSDNIHTDVENAIGGSGADTITGSPGANGLDGGAGADNMNGGAGNDGLSGSAGNDSVAGGDGIDSLAGGDGDDRLDGGSEGDSMSGGEGSDLADYAARAVGVTVSLDGNPGDGEPGEGDDVEADVENVNGGSGADSFFGSASANALDGGAGEDYEDGGTGNDRLTGGDAGDVLRSRDGQSDQLVCGPGPDFVIGDAADGANADCDRIDRGVNQKPKLRDSAVVAPRRGTLTMSPRGIVRRVPLQDKVVLPLRSVVDTVAGAVKVTSSASSRKVQSVTLDSGAFNISQAAGRLPVTQFALQGGDFSVCPSATRAGRATASAKAKTVRRLWANGKGKFRTKGRYASATIRGTKWQIQDRCDGTLVTVARGAVTVRDLVRRKNVVVKAGHTYLARRR